MPRGRVRGAQAPRPAPERPARARGGRRRRHFDISAAPEPSTGGVGGITLAKGYHPYYCAIDGAGKYIVVRTFHGQNPVEVSVHKTPRAALDEMVALNKAVADAAAAG